MKKSRFKPSLIASILKELDGGKSADEITRDNGVSKASLYKWRQLFGGMEALELDTAKYIIEKML